MVDGTNREEECPFFHLLPGTRNNHDVSVFLRPNILANISSRKIYKLKIFLKNHCCSRENNIKIALKGFYN